MNEQYLTRFRERSAYEADRSAPPPDFPELPDLPLGRYTDAAFFELERERLFKRSWVYAVHDSQLGEPGAYVLRDIVDAPVVIVRGADGVVRAFMNACQHRGAPVVRGECGVTRRLTCQYHSWSYELDGTLVTVPDERDFVGLCREQRGLRPVRCEAWGGWWFVNLDDEAMPLLEWLDPLPRLLDDIAASPVRVIDTKSVELDCNWKVMAEAFLEVYHARTIHPTTVAPVVDTRGTVISLFDHGHQNMISPVKPGTRNDGRENLATLARLPALFRESLQPAHGIFPNLITPLDRHGFPFLVFWPLATDRTRLDITWFAPDWGDGELPQPEVWEGRLRRFDQVMDEDYENLKPVQQAIEAAGHTGHVLNYQERRIWHLHAWIDKFVGSHHVADELRVPDLLADWVEVVD